MSDEMKRNDDHYIKLIFVAIFAYALLFTSFLYNALNIVDFLFGVFSLLLLRVYVYTVHVAFVVYIYIYIYLHCIFSCFVIDL